MRYRVSDLADLNIRSVSKNAKGVIYYIDTSSVFQGHFREANRYSAIADAPSRARRLAQEGDTVISMVRPSNEHIGFIDFDTDNYVFSTGFVVVHPNSEIVEPFYLYLLLSLDSTTRYLQQIAETSTTAYPSVKVEDIGNLSFDIPEISKQRKIVHKIRIIEQKIKLNQEINDNLDELSTVIFDRWIRNSSSDVKCPLDHVAKYTNGLAMQKFRPQNNEIGLPVVKIRELNQGDTDENSDYCTSNIDQSVKVNTGDIIFSWSGTLTLDIWAGGEAGLNQHLFKVTSSKYPYWFVFEWTKYYLKSFQNIAKSKATTMGHIKRSDLHSSLVKIPTHDEMIELNTTLSPMYSQKIAIRHENRVLYQMKQQLLSKYF